MILACADFILHGSVDLPTPKVPALAAVQTAKATLAESLTQIRPRFSTAFCTGMLKTFCADALKNLSAQKKPPEWGGLVAAS